MTATFVALFGIILVAALIWRRRPVRAVTVAILTCCLLSTAYVILIDPNPQAPIFLMFVYALAAFAGILVLALCHFGKVFGRWLDRDPG